MILNATIEFETNPFYKLPPLMERRLTTFGVGFATSCHQMVRP